MPSPKDWHHDTTTQQKKLVNTTSSYFPQKLKAFINIPRKQTNLKNINLKNKKKKFKYIFQKFI